MSGTEAYKHFGLSCSEGGNYYICEDSPVQFIGCCTSDPCGSNNGTCPDGDLRSSTFNSDSYEDLPVQDCDDDRGSTIWYACKFVSPPFMGCCSQNACSNEGCSRSRLIPAKLSSVEKNRLEFLEPDGTSPSSTSTSTSSSSSSSTASDEPSSGGGGLSTGAIAGIAVGAAVVGILVLAFLIWMFWWKPRKNKQDGQQFQPVAQPQQPDTPDAYGQSSFSPAAMTPVMSNHHQSYASTPATVAPYYPSAVSPDMYQKYSPQTSQFERPHSIATYADHSPSHSPNQGYMQPYGNGHMVPVQEMDGTAPVVQELGTGNEDSIPQSQNNNAGLGISK